MDPDPRCDEACVDGFVWDTSLASCRAPRTCAQLGCAAMGQGCNAATSTTDAECVTDCPAGEGFDPQSGGCFRCGSGGLALSGSCNRTGETRRLIVETGVVDGVCFCETQTGYFPELNHAAPCDADEDGWVTSAALNAIENAQANVRLNARCDLREIDRVRLTNEAGTSLDDVLTTPLPLYESPRNDGASSATLPTYRSASVPAAVLNSFTKGCDTVTADFNHNGLSDVSEGQTDTSSVMGAASLSGYYDRYTAYAYFMELHDGYFLAGSGGAPGTYVIAERPRTGSADGVLPLQHASGESDPYWRHCDRHDDILYSTGGATSRAGGDFSCAGASGCLRAMFHHSQFRCAVGQTLGGYGSATAASAPTRAIANGGGLIWSEGGMNRTLGNTNDCTLTATTFTRTPSFANSELPTFACAPAAASDNGVRAQWVVVDYVSVPTAVTDGTTPIGQANYVRGCINECDELGVTQCPGYDGSNPHLRCWSDEALNDFGRIECGCRRTDGNGSCQPGAMGVACTASCGTTGTGTCTAACVPPTGAACVPPAETCDAVDNDCDTFVDEGTRVFSGTSGTLIGDDFDIVGMSDGFLGFRRISANQNHAFYQLTDALATRPSASWDSATLGMATGFGLSRASGSDAFVWSVGSEFGSQGFQRVFTVGMDDGWTPPSTGNPPTATGGNGGRAIAVPGVGWAAFGQVSGVLNFSNPSGATSLATMVDLTRGASAILRPDDSTQVLGAIGRAAATPMVVRVVASTRVSAASQGLAGGAASRPLLVPLSGGRVAVLSVRDSDGQLQLHVLNASTLSCVTAACPAALGLVPTATTDPYTGTTTFEAVEHAGQILVFVATSTQGVLASFTDTGVERWRQTLAGSPAAVAIAKSGTGALVIGTRAGTLILHRTLQCGP